MSKLGTIQVAIDLGTTNSTIAINKSGKVEVIKNTFGDSSTPSVFGVDKSSNLVVGKRAYEKLYRDTSSKEVANYKAEVKRLMGTKEKVNFPRIEKDLSAEEISAEILKALKVDVTRKYPEFYTDSVVVTIPAHFSTVQAEATKRACELAGFKHAVLLQEPIAAAMSYGFGSDKDHNWIVYDLGGGTFDVAVISSKDGILSCVSHCGDNFLGGKDFDWLIVDKVLVPHIREKFKLTNFDRGNPENHWKFAKLKYLAENAKIYLTEYENTTIEIDGLGDDEEGEEISSVLQFSRTDFEKLVQPLIERTINLSRDVMKESGLDSKSIEKLVLVGGPTQIPFLREQLNKNLGVEVDTSSDPLTAVAHGACIFAVGQEVPAEILKSSSGPVDQSAAEITINCERMTSDSEEAVSGIIDLSKKGESDYFIQIQSEDGTFSTSKIPLKNGKFYQSVTVQPNKQNHFWIYLLDGQGNSVALTQDSFCITHGLTVSGAPLPHTVGVGITKKQYGSETQIIETIDKFFEKNSTLPLKETKTYKTFRPLKKGDTSNALPVKVYEGESEIPDRNQIICQLGITGEKIPYDLPEGTDVDITISVDTSRTVTVEAYLPTVDLRLNARATVHAEDVTTGDIEKDLGAQEERARGLNGAISNEEESKLNSEIQTAREALKNSEADEDEKRRASKLVKDLKSKIDASEKDKEFPTLKMEFEKINEQMKAIFEVVTESERSNEFIALYEQIKKDGEMAISSQDKALLTRVIDQLLTLRAQITFEDPGFLVYRLEQFASGDFHFIDEDEANYFIKKGRRAIELGDLEELKRAVRNLVMLLPPEEQNMSLNNISGITK